MQPQVTMKTTPFSAITRYMGNRMAAADGEKLLAGLAASYPDDVRRVTSGRMLASDRLSLSFATELIERMAADLHEDPERAAYDIGWQGAEAATGTVLRWVIGLLAITSYFGKIDTVWSQYYSHGRITYAVKDRTALIELHDFPFVSSTNCARVTGSLSWFGQKAEKTAVVRHVTCRSKGEDMCRWSAAW